MNYNKILIECVKLIIKNVNNINIFQFYLWNLGESKNYNIKEMNAMRHKNIFGLKIILSISTNP